jgi:SSS family transporter
VHWFRRLENVLLMSLPQPTLPLAVGLQPIDYVIVFGYMTGMMCVGVYFARRQTNIQDFFVAGRRMPWLATGLSLIATLMSTLSYLGAPGEMIKHGIGQSISLLALPFAFVVVGFLWVPFYMRLNLTSAYEYLERRFGTGARMLGVSLYLYMRFVWMGMIVFTASRAVADITQETAPQAISQLTGGLIQFTTTGWFYFVLIATGVVSTLYTMLGGIAAVIWTDVIQFIVLFSGAVATLVIVGMETGTGPVTWYREVTSVSHQLPPLFSWDLSTRVTLCFTVMTGFFWHVCTHASDQVALQRYFATQDASAARRTALVNYTADITMQLLLATTGAALLAYYLRHPGALPEGVSDPRAAGVADSLFPRFINHGLPVGVSGLVVAALFAVAQSSIDSGINSTATVLTIDVIRRFRRELVSDKTELRRAQWLTLGIGLFITLTAVLVAVYIARDSLNIIDLQMKGFNCVLGPLGAIFMAGMLLRHVGQQAIVAAGLIGTFVGGSIAWLGIRYGDEGPSTFLIIPLSWAVTILAAAVLGGFLPPPRPEQVRGLTWRSVVINHEQAT